MIYEYNITGCNDTYTSLTALRKNFTKSKASVISKRIGWIEVVILRKDRTMDSVGMISYNPSFKNGIWTDMDKESLYGIDSSGKLKRLHDVEYPSRYNAYPKHARYLKANRKK